MVEYIFFKKDLGILKRLGIWFTDKEMDRYRKKNYYAVLEGRFFKSSKIIFVNIEDMYKYGDLISISLIDNICETLHHEHIHCEINEILPTLTSKELFKTKRDGEERIVIKILNE